MISIDEASRYIGDWSLITGREEGLHIADETPWPAATANTLE